MTLIDLRPDQMRQKLADIVGTGAETGFLLVRHIYVQKWGSCANSAQMFLTFSVHSLFDCECLDICLVKIRWVLKKIYINDKMFLEYN